MRDQSSWKAYLGLGLFMIAFAIAAMIFISLGASPEVGRLGSWAVLGVPLGVAVSILAFAKRRKERGDK
ncbi:hypothetical protein GCM10022202_18750 [Microbacterium marinilacus]|uniref:Uncharacterized protein n=1 Tax=Microbacterium marinilacus TaxID=415209 RepID=A0ABP7BFM6_9MICO